MQRRNFLQLLLSVAATMLLAPITALAASWNKAAFESATLSGAIKGLEIPAETPSADIEIIAPDRAENGAVVQVQITSRIPDTESIAILVEKNPTPLIATFNFSNGALPFIVTRIKMAENSDIKAVIKAGDRYFTASHSIEVLENGCN